MFNLVLPEPLYKIPIHITETTNIDFNVYIITGLK
jgi:hypothetical protein